MADVKISELPVATALDGSESIEIVQAGVSKRTLASQVAAVGPSATATQTANTVWAGPAAAPAALPTFRALVAADIPTSGADYLVKTAHAELTAERVVTDNSAAGGAVWDWATAGQVKAKLYASGADKIIYSTGANAWAEQSVTAAGRALINSTATADVGGNVSGIVNFLISGIAGFGGIAPLDPHSKVFIQTSPGTAAQFEIFQAGVAIALLGSNPSDTNFYLTNAYFGDPLGTAGKSITLATSGKTGFGTTSPAYTVDVNGTLNCSGALSKGSGTFLIDHPLDPLNKDLKHGFVEAPRYDLLYRGRVTLAGGQATVDIDAASRMTAGTFAALTQNAEVVSLCNRSGFARVRATEIAGGTFSIFCEDANSADEIAWVVLAERHDPFIINDDGSWTDQDGRLVPERDKPD